MAPYSKDPTILRRDGLWVIERPRRLAQLWDRAADGRLSSSWQADMIDVPAGRARLLPGRG
jgi:hypothetical protein